MLNRKYSSRFKKDLKKFSHKKEVLEEFDSILKLLIAKEKLPTKYREHYLSGNYETFCECHVKPDILLIYQKNDNHIYLYRIGSHSELF